MQKNKLIKLLRSLDRKEMTRFREFAFSPYHNKHERVRQLISYLDACYPDFHEKNCDRQLLYGELFPGIKYDQARLAVVFTYAQRLFEQFLTQEQLAQENRSRKKLLLARYRQKQLYAWYEKLLETTQEAVKETRLRHSSYYQWQYELAIEKDHFNTHIKKRREDRSLQEKQQNLDLFYLAEKLKDAVELQIRRNILKVEYSNRLLDSVLTEVGQNLELYKEVPAIFLYYKIYEMAAHPEHHFYFAALDILKQYEHHFPKEELAGIYNYFQNYCIREINHNQSQFLLELFRLYQSQLEQALIIEEGYLSEWHYKNIVTTGIRLRELDWVKHFIETYKDRLPPEDAENAYLFNLASYCYATRQYGKVLDLLAKVEYNHLRYSLGSKALLLRTYYELEEFEALFSLCDSFVQYLQRNQLMADSRRHGYSNLFKLTRRAAHIKANHEFVSKQKTERELERLKEEIGKTDEIFNKAWLQEKVSAL